MIWILGAILTLFIANILKVLRQSLFVDLYDNSDKKSLMQALSISNIINYFVPFKLGYIFRIYFAGKKMKYGMSYSLATIVVEIILDFFCVSFIYFIFLILGFDSVKNILFYLISLVALLIIGIIFKICKKNVKKLIYNFSHIFNKSIELKILKSSWFTIISFENIVSQVDKIKLIFYSVSMWMLNVLSCYFFGKSIIQNTSLVNIFDLYFSHIGIRSNLVMDLSVLGINTLIYVIVSNLMLFVISFIFRKKGNKKHRELLPHSNLNDRLNFLELYFNNNDNSAYFKKYLEINNDVAIIEDFSAGSNATTMLCSKDGQLFYRKYSFGKDADKLKEQIDWIHEHESKLTLTKISNEYYSHGVCLYDMPFVDNAVSCFNFVHTNQFDYSWSTLKKALIDIDKNLHSINRRKADEETISKYIDSKVTKNIEKIESAQSIKPILKYEYIYINGKKYNNLNYFKKYLNEEHLKEIFKDDFYSDIHGDFTIENIICLKKKSKKNFYIIDPNTGNLHNSPYLDYAKLLQSIHGGYEFLMNTKNVSYENNKIEFLFTKSSVYNKLLDELVIYLKEKFGEKALKSIFYHEIIHWLRLMPYKINKNEGEKSLLFYAGLIMVATDVEKRFEK